MNVLQIENQPTIEGACHDRKWNGGNIEKMYRQRYISNTSLMIWNLVLALSTEQQDTTR